MSKPLLVVDTNVVLDLLYFADPGAQPILQALEAGRARCVVSDATLDEFRRVLAYPEFALAPPQQAALLARYEALAETAGGTPGGADVPHGGAPIHQGLKPVGSRMPRCSDPDDQKFLELAAAVSAHALVSKDRALLKLQRRCAPRFRILAPAEAVRWLGEASA